MPLQRQDGAHLLRHRGARPLPGRATVARRRRRPLTPKPDDRVGGGGGGVVLGLAGPLGHPDLVCRPRSLLGVGVTWADTRPDGSGARAIKPGRPERPALLLRSSPADPSPPSPPSPPWNASSTRDIAYTPRSRSTAHPP
ncbi:t69.1 [Tupaiid betaherpesvirus 1]|uniref:T69.1 n=1 Tax=Tupaiid herpesvirus 1 (strain 1) TaxID=10397 RepID=Q91TM7_TUHV1|nr:t69.1 [Tupaiid betaherpesvirus 1]AAK57114.1 t69.1 [Tupaiid betaherpesvirus 1]